MLRQLFGQVLKIEQPSANEVNQAAGIPPILVELKDTAKVYSSLAGPLAALKGINLAVHAGEYLVVTGKSGSGKTTLVNMITGLDRCTSGEVWVLGTPLHRMSAGRLSRWRRFSVGVVFQAFELVPTLTVLQNVTLPMDFAGSFSLHMQRRRGMQLLEQMGIAEHAGKMPAQISGGQQQRVAIARALANDPPLLVADEPTGSLDSQTASRMLEIFAVLVREGRTLILVSHDPDLVRSATRGLRLLEGRLLE